MGHCTSLQCLVSCCRFMAVCLGQPRLLRAMSAGLLSARGSRRNGFCLVLLQKAVGGEALVVFENDREHWESFRVFPV